MSSPKVKKRNFSSFNLAEAYREVGIKRLVEWFPEFSLAVLTDFFSERLRRLKAFDLTSNETAKELIIDAFLEEGLQSHQNLKAWKEQFIEGETLNGIADYLLTESIDYFDIPFLCVVEAKKDDFEQGLAQCLVEMEVCQEANEKAGKTIDIFGVVTNGETWKFYKMTKTDVYASEPFVISDEEKLIGILNYIFSECEKNLAL